jgi:hypothetical protein
MSDTSPDLKADLPSALTDFVAGLTALQTQLTCSNPDGRSLSALFLMVQQHYQQGLSPALQEASHHQPIHTEINRSLRLLGMDVAFLQSAQRSLTAQKHQAQMQQRLADLLILCQGLWCNQRSS